MQNIIIKICKIVICYLLLSLFFILIDFQLYESFILPIAIVGVGLAIKIANDPNIIVNIEITEDTNSKMNKTPDWVKRATDANYADHVGNIFHSSSKLNTWMGNKY
ncbi:MAG: hypothetical protein HQK79_21975 [Desulfobacterales bacterium]|nr:hypothetical protein [Desulfobacterales bacterium]